MSPKPAPSPWCISSRRKGRWVLEAVLRATSEAEATRRYLKLAGPWAKDYELRVERMASYLR